MNELVNKNTIAKWPKMKLLIVDDMKAIRELLINILTSLNFTNFTQAENGEEAWGKIQSTYEAGEKFDLIISDIHMPKMNGVELLSKVKQSDATCNIPFILVTTENEREIVMEAIEWGVSNYILKPLEKDVIKRKLIEVLYSE